jgi:uncharacterized iron-regulated protein
MIRVLFSMLMLLTAACSTAAASTQTQDGAREGVVYDARSGLWLSLQDAVAELPATAVVLMGEEHAVKDPTPEEQLRQVQWLQRVSARSGPNTQPVSVGMEFFAYTGQQALDAYLQDPSPLNEATLLKDAEWGSNPFAAYRQQVLWPTSTGGATFALNIPRRVTRQVARGGPSSLTDEQRALLPPIWEQGSASYRERFTAAMQGHASPEQLENFFWAQSLWDDTMAWRIKQTFSQGLYHVIVGSFHVDYGHGLAARLLRQDVKNVITWRQVGLCKLDHESMFSAVQAHPIYGARADLTWVYQIAPDSEHCAHKNHLGQ